MGRKFKGWNVLYLIQTPHSWYSVQAEKSRKYHLYKVIQQSKFIFSLLVSHFPDFVIKTGLIDMWRWPFCCRADKLHTHHRFRCQDLNNPVLSQGLAILFLWMSVEWILGVLMRYPSLHICSAECFIDTVQIVLECLLSEWIRIDIESVFQTSSLSVTNKYAYTSQFS